MEKSVIEYFISLVQIDSVSKNEKATAERLVEDLKELGAEVTIDNAGERCGGNVGNVYAYFSGNINKKPILFCAHMDTVEPGIGIKPQIKDDRIVSDGTTILAADDKAGIAEIIWAIKELKESDEETAPFEVLFTIGEEVGLFGAKYLDYSLIKSEIGYALDSDEIGQLSIGSPNQNSLEITIYGKETHAGVHPENGISAIQIAAEAISKIPHGRIDFETTCNIGVIKGGEATNIVPKKVYIEGEVRSQNRKKLNNLTDKIVSTFKEVTDKYYLDDYKATIDIKVIEEYASFLLEEDEEVIKLARTASEKLGFPYHGKVSGGGSDANIFNHNGLRIAVAGAGMHQYHTVNEYVKIDELQNCVKWVKEIIRIYSAS